LTVAPDCELLMKAVLAKPPCAETYWRRWRSQTDLDSMSGDCIRLLPVLVARRSSWLADDPSRHLILGLAKRAWTRNQIILRSFVDLVASLARAGVRQPAIAGPPAWALLHQGEKSFRPISFLELLVSREQALPTAGALVALGWAPAHGQPLPRPVDFDYIEGIWFRNQAGEGLKLTWRLFPAPPERTAEWETLPPFETVEFQGATLFLPSGDVMLASALAGERDGDHLHWRCDSALLLSGNNIDWARVRKWIQFLPAARPRLLELARETGAAIPSNLRRRPARLWFQWDLVWGDYRRRAWIRREPLSLRTFFRYLCERWQTPAWKAPFLGLYYLVRYTFSGRAGGE
jgi:hypothetical protein